MMPGPQEVIGWGGKEPASINRFAPLGITKLAQCVCVGEKPKIPGSAETSQIVHLCRQVIQRQGRWLVRVKAAINLEAHR